MEYSNMMAHPLYWPEGWKRERYRSHARYKLTFVEARKHLLKQVQLLGGSNPVISSNMPLRQDGLPLAGGYREPSDPGVAIYWTKKGVTHVMACDHWHKTVDNMRALGLALEALRAVDRSGASQVLERAFAGFASLPAPVSGWRATLGFAANENPSREALKERYRQRIFENHPDRGGSEETTRKIIAAHAAALLELRYG